jgi:hypothetical protein
LRAYSQHGEIRAGATLNDGEETRTLRPLHAADKRLRERVRSSVKFAHRLCGQPLPLRVGCEHCGAVLAQADSRLVD